MDAATEIFSFLPERVNHALLQISISTSLFFFKNITQSVIKIKSGKKPYGLLRRSYKKCQQGVRLHIARIRIISDDPMQSKIVITALRLVAEIGRDFIISRTQEALAKRKSERMKLGRPVGGAKNLKLDKQADKIESG